MKNNYIYRSFWGIVCLALSASFSGCIKEDLTVCPHNLPRVRVIPDALPDTVMPEVEDLGTVRLYVFDEDRNFIATIRNAVAGEWITLDYPDAGPLYVAAVVNLDTETENIPTYESGDRIESSSIAIKTTGAHIDRRVYCSPGDLFEGSVQVVNRRTDPEDLDLPVTRITSQTNIQIDGMKRRYGLDCENLTVAVLNTYNTVNLSREYSGHQDNTPVLHMPAGSFTKADLHATPTFNMLSGDEGQAVTLEVWDGGTLIETFSHDYKGDPFVAINGRLLEIRISYYGDVLVVIQDYGEWIMDDPFDKEF